MKKSLLIFFLVTLMLTGCGQASSEPTITPTTLHQNTPLPTASLTAEPTSTETLVPTPTSIPLPNPITVENLSGIKKVTSLAGRYTDFISSNNLLVISSKEDFFARNTATQGEVFRFEGRYIASSPDEKYFSMKNGEVLDIRDSSTGDLVMQVNEFMGVQFHPIEEKILVSNNEKGTAQLWEIGGSFPIREFKMNKDFEGRPWGFHVSMDGQFIIGIEAFKLLIWDSNTGDLLHEFTHDNDGGVFRINPTKNMIAYKTGGPGWKIIDLRSGNVLYTVRKNQWVEFSSDGKFLLIRDGALRLIRFVDTETFEITTAISGIEVGFNDINLNLISIIEADAYNFHYSVYNRESFEQIFYIYSGSDLIEIKSNQSELLILIQCKYYCYPPYSESNTRFYSIFTGELIFELPFDGVYYSGGVFSPDDRWLFLSHYDEDNNYFMDIWEVPE